jgi:two-component system, cell cycle sensor histidine kinase and response regulator CckA
LQFTQNQEIETGMKHLAHQPNSLWSPPNDNGGWPIKSILVSVSAGVASAVLIAWATKLWLIIMLLMAVCGVAIAVIFGMHARAHFRANSTSKAIDNTQGVYALLNHIDCAAIVTTAEGHLNAANIQYKNMVSGYPSLKDIIFDDGKNILSLLNDVKTNKHGKLEISLQGQAYQLVGEYHGDDLFFWKFNKSTASKMLQDFALHLNGALGDLVGERGGGMLVADAGGRIVGSSASVPILNAVPRNSLIGTLLADWLSYAEGRLVWQAGSDHQFFVDALETILKTPEGIEAGHVIELSLAATTKSTEGIIPVSGERNPPLFVDGLPLPLALTDRDGRLLYFNKLFALTTGLGDLTSAPTQYPADLVVDEDRLALSDLVRRVGSGVSPKQMAIVRLRIQKEEPVQLTVTPIGTGGSRAGGIATVVTLSDNAERRKLEQQVAQAQKMQGIGQLAGGIAHDFNNILTAISGFCELLLQRHPPGDPSFSDINQVFSNANRAAALVKQLLAFSRQQTLRPVTVQITDLLTEQLVTLKRLIGEGVRLDVQHGRDLGSVRVDPTQFYQVVMNLVVNARDAMPDGGRISIRTYNTDLKLLPKSHADLLQEHEYVGIEVADSGGGIPADILPKIFEPFFTTKDVGKGTGLGLSTAYGIVKQSNGFIFADSVTGKGTTFSIYLPSFQIAQTLDVAATKKLEIVDDLWGSGTILLVEDEDAVRAFAVKALERKGYKVLPADGGEEALEILSGDPAAIDLIVSDVVMPNMDGPAMAKVARELRPDVPIIFVSGYAEETLRQSLTDVMDTANVTFLPKPFSLKELAKAVKTVMDKTKLN